MVSHVFLLSLVSYFYFCKLTPVCSFRSITGGKADSLALSVSIRNFLLCVIPEKVKMILCVNVSYIYLKRQAFF